MLLFILSLCGFADALATRLLDPLITSIAADFATSVGVVALLASAFALPFGFSQPFLGPMGDAFGKAVVIKCATAVLAIFLAVSALAPDLTLGRNGRAEAIASRVVASRRGPDAAAPCSAQ